MKRFITALPSMHMLFCHVAKSGLCSHNLSFLCGKICYCKVTSMPWWFLRALFVFFCHVFCIMRLLI